ncbi:unnamed protein product [Adineta ricciae]|uniref:Bardet-Biedl syndrome 7 protein n=1 Tax=Adineta ricciae TaxID=249248 RepID=A0A815ZGW4_ADIRI|nr:unnamed protein product [Adineta ricciae]
MLELQLNRVDYLKTISSIPTKCMRLLSRENVKKDTQKLALGESNGSVQLFSIRKKDTSTIFKTAPGKRINRIELGGRLGEIPDRIFVAAENEVKGYSKKGKQFYAFDTNINEPIRCMSILGSSLYTCTETTYTHYIESKETDTVTFAAKMNDIVVLPLPIQAMPVVACQDRLLRPLHKSSVLYDAEVPGIPTTLILSNKNGGPTKSEVVYGTSDGRLGQLEIGSISANSKWEIANPKHLSGISAIDFYDILADGVPDMIVAREDGTVEVYNFETTDEPVLKFTFNGTESITNIEGGVVGNPNYDELICCTYQGWIFGLTTQPLQNDLGGEVVTAQNDDLKNRIDDLKNEIDELQRRLMVARERYQDVIKSDTRALSTIREFRVNDRFELNRDDATYNLMIESEIPIDNVLLQCDVILDVLDVEKNSAVMSFSDCDPRDNNAVLVTYRCQMNTTRLEMHVRTIEGHYGTLQLYITSKIQPRCSMLRRHTIKPLSLHQRSSSAIDPNKRMNTMKITGSFSYAEIHSWIQFCLADVPERPPIEKENRLVYTNIFLQTQLECIYKQDEAIFRSENVSTISILKDVMSKKATEKKITLDISYELSNETIAITLGQILPMIAHYKTLTDKYNLIEPLQELVMDGSSDNILTPEYRQVLANAESIREQHKQTPVHLNRLCSMVADLFIDKHKFEGTNVKAKIPTLFEKLNTSFTQPQIFIDFFNSL